jgi:hypothetical protein
MTGPDPSFPPSCGSASSIIDDAFAGLERQVADQRKEAAALKTRIAGLGAPPRRHSRIGREEERRGYSDAGRLSQRRGKARAAKYREQPFCRHIVNVVAPLIRAAKPVPTKAAMTTKAVDSLGDRRKREKRGG